MNATFSLFQLHRVFFTVIDSDHRGALVIQSFVLFLQRPCVFCDVKSRDTMITNHSTPTQKYNSSKPDAQLSGGVAKELAAWIGIFVLVCVVSDLVVQCSPHFGTACIAGTILSVVLAARRRGQLEILPRQDSVGPGHQRGNLFPQSARD